MNIFRNIKQLPPFKKAVITIGSFDGIHAGHQKILKKVTTLAYETGGESIVITFDPHPRTVIDNTNSKVFLLNSLKEKLELLESFGIDNVVIVPFTFEFSQQMPREYIEKFIISNFNPAFVVLGYDHRFGMHRRGDITLFREYEAEGKFKVVEIPREDVDQIAVSSTKIRKALLAGEVEEANQYLKYNYIITGRVIDGDKLGTKLGYPTANLKPDDANKLLPCHGIYAVEIEIDGGNYDGMLYIGHRPTVGDDLKSVIEINILDFNQNIYDKEIKVKFLRYIRDDIKFDSLEDMTAQIRKDEIDIRAAIREIKLGEPAKPLITLAVLNYNGQELLESYLPSLEYSSSKYEFEILVIDNNSTDSSLEFIKEWFPEVKTSELSQNYGYAGGYNNGLSQVKTKYIALLNSDVAVEENWLDPIIDKLESDRSIGAAQPTIRSMENKEYFEYAGAAGGFIDIAGYPFCRGRLFNTIEKDEGQYSDTKEIFWASGAAMVVRNDLFKKMGGFDPGFFAHQEEIDFCWRIKNAGYKVFCIPKSTVYHLGGSTLSYSNPRKDFLNFRNNVYMLTKNMTLLRLAWIIPLKLIMDGIAGLKFILTGHPRSAISIIKAHLSFYIHLPLVLERRNKEFHWIKNNRIGSPNMTGQYSGLVVWKYYIEQVKKFSKLKL